MSSYGRTLIKRIMKNPMAPGHGLSRNRQGKVVNAQGKVLGDHYPNYLKKENEGE